MKASYLNSWLLHRDVVRIKKTTHQVILALIPAQLPSPPSCSSAPQTISSGQDRDSPEPTFGRDRAVGGDSEQRICLGPKLHVSSGCACCSVEVFVEGFRIKLHGKCCSDKGHCPPCAGGPCALWAAGVSVWSARRTKVWKQRWGSQSLVGQLAIFQCCFFTLGKDGV